MSADKHLLEFGHSDGLVVALQLDEAWLVEVEIETRVVGGEVVAEKRLESIVVRRQRSCDGSRDESKEREEFHDERRLA